MKIILTSRYELLEKLSSGQLTFENGEHTTELVNLICQNVVDSNDDDTDIFSFLGYGAASDLGEWCRETLMFDGWEVDWFDVVTCSIDARSLTDYICSSYDVPYSFEEAQHYIEEVLQDWAYEALEYFKSHLKGHQCTLNHQINNGSIPLKGC